MATLVQVKKSQYAASNTQSSLSIVNRFMSWCEAQEDYRYPILVGILMIQGCIIVPLVYFAILKFESAITPIGVFLTGFSSLAILVVNLAQVPMKVVISSFLINLLLLSSIVALNFV